MKWVSLCLPFNILPDCKTLSHLNATIGAELPRGRGLAALSHIARIACLCDESCPSRCELQSLDGLICTSLMVNEVKNLFACHSKVCFGKIPVQVFALLLKINSLFWKNFRSREKLQQWHRVFLSTHHSVSTTVDVSQQRGAAIETQEQHRVHLP